MFCLSYVYLQSCLSVSLSGHCLSACHPVCLYRGLSVFFPIPRSLQSLLLILFIAALPTSVCWPSCLNCLSVFQWLHLCCPFVSLSVWLLICLSFWSLACCLNCTYFCVLSYPVQLACQPVCLHVILSTRVASLASCLSFDLAAFLPVCHLLPSFCYSAQPLLLIVSVAILPICGCWSFWLSVFQ